MSQRGIYASQITTLSRLLKSQRRKANMLANISQSEDAVVHWRKAFPAKTDRGKEKNQTHSEVITFPGQPIPSLLFELLALILRF